MTGTAAAAPPLIMCRDVSFGYDGRPVVRGLTFGVERGDYLCVTGENGAGKSTVMKGLLRLLPPLRGDIAFAPELRAGGTGYVSQAAAARSDFPAGAREIALSGLSGRAGFRPFYTGREKALARECLERMGVGDLAARCFRELSGGQQRRVLIARALAASGVLLALDEPAAGLDPAAAAGLYETLAELNRDGVAVVMVTHDIDAAARYARRVLHLGDAADTGAPAAAPSALFFGSAADYARSAFYKKFSHTEVFSR